jgi:hypothetical protein
MTSAEAQEITLASPFLYPRAATLIEDQVARRIHKAMKPSQPPKLPEMHKGGSSNEYPKIMAALADGKWRTIQDVMTATHLPRRQVENGLSSLVTRGAVRCSKAHDIKCFQVVT